MGDRSRQISVESMPDWACPRIRLASREENAAAAVRQGRESRPIWVRGAGSDTILGHEEDA